MSNAIITGDGIEVYESNIESYLQQYIDERGIGNMNKETQGRWNAALLYINKYVFTDQSLLMSEVNKSMYDEYKVNRLCDIYINICYENDKEISVLGFSKLTGINPDTIYSWRNEEYRSNIYYDSDGNRIGNIQMWRINHPGEEYRQELGSSCSEVYKKLHREREESLSGMLISGKKNPVGLLGALNRHYGWNMGQPRGQIDSKTHRTPEEIAADYEYISISEDVKPDF